MKEVLNLNYIKETEIRGECSKLSLKVYADVLLIANSKHSTQNCRRDDTLNNAVASWCHLLYKEELDPILCVVLHETKDCVASCVTQCNLSNNLQCNCVALHVADCLSVALH